MNRSSMMSMIKGGTKMKLRHMILWTCKMYEEEAYRVRCGTYTDREGDEQPDYMEGSLSDLWYIILPITYLFRSYIYVQEMRKERELYRQWIDSILDRIAKAEDEEIVKELMDVLIDVKDQMKRDGHDVKEVLS